MIVVYVYENKIYLGHQNHFSEPERGATSLYKFSETSQQSYVQDRSLDWFLSRNGWNDALFDKAESSYFGISADGLQKI